MTTYNYTCNDCAHEWEATQAMRDEPLHECPRCHKQTARRLISLNLNAAILQGTGWARDGYVRYV